MNYLDPIKFRGLLEFCNQTTLSPEAASDIPRHEYIKLAAQLNYTPYQQAHVWLCIQAFKKADGGGDKVDDDDDKNSADIDTHDGRNEYCNRNNNKNNKNNNSSSCNRNNSTENNKDCNRNDDNRNETKNNIKNNDDDDGNSVIILQDNDETEPESAVSSESAGDGEILMTTATATTMPTTASSEPVIPGGNTLPNSIKDKKKRKKHEVDTERQDSHNHIGLDDDDDDDDIGNNTVSIDINGNSNGNYIVGDTFNNDQETNSDTSDGFNPTLTTRKNVLVDDSSIDVDDFMTNDSFVDGDSDDSSYEDFSFPGKTTNGPNSTGGDSKKRKEGPSTTEDMWLRAVQQAKEFYRMRIFVTRAKCKETDKYGRSPSDWALTRGMVVAELPSNVAELFQSRTLMSSVVLQTLMARTCPSTTSGTLWSMYKKYCAMKKGDIIAMLVPGPTRKHVAAFGVIKDSYVHLRETEQFGKDFHFPVPAGLPDVFPYLLGRSVEWYWTCPVRDLPAQCTSKLGADYVGWLVETAPLFFLNVTRHGIRNHIMSEKFFQNSTCIRK